MGALKIRLDQGLAKRGAALMGVLNVTPDSFYDGGRYAELDSARAAVDEMLVAGADIIDIGGESSRPGAKPVSTEEQIARIEPVVRHAVARGAVVSIDTTDPSVADRMLALGAELVNDISCLGDPDLARVCAVHKKTLVLMHSRGPMQNMLGFSMYPDDAYRDVVDDVLSEWQHARERALQAGMTREAIWFDPGVGFSKNAKQSFEVLRGLDRFLSMGVPVVVGPSRKSFIAAVDDVPADQRLGGTIAAALFAVEKGASVLRVHDVRDVHQALAVARSIRFGLGQEARGA